MRYEFKLLRNKPSTLVSVSLNTSRHAKTALFTKSSSKNCQVNIQAGTVLSLDPPNRSYELQRSDLKI